MYCELGEDVCGEIGHLRHEKETVCIVSWERMHVGRSDTGDTRKRLYVYMYVGRSGAWYTRRRLYVL